MTTAKNSHKKWIDAVLKSLVAPIPRRSICQNIGKFLELNSKGAGGGGGGGG